MKLLWSQRLAVDLLGLAPAPRDIWAEVRPSGCPSGGPDEAIDTPTTLLPSLEVQNLHLQTLLLCNIDISAFGTEEVL